MARPANTPRSVRSPSHAADAVTLGNGYAAGELATAAGSGSVMASVTATAPLHYLRPTASRAMPSRIASTSRSAVREAAEPPGRIGRR